MYSNLVEERSSGSSQYLNEELLPGSSICVTLISTTEEMWHICVITNK